MVQRESIKLDGQLDLDLEETTEDRDGTPALINKDLQVVEGVAELSQSLLVRLSTRRGEQTFFPNAGLPIRDMIRNQDEDGIATIVKSEVLKDPLVAAVPSVDVLKLNPRLRAALVRIRYRAVTGEEGTVEVTV